MKGWKVICTADFNGGYGHDSGVYRDVKPWLDDHFLDNLPHSYTMEHPDDSNLSDLTTRGTVSLDYITTNLPGFKYHPFRPSSLQHIDTISDHKPIFADFHCPSLRTKPVYRPPQHLDLKNKSDVETFQSMLTTENAPQPPGPQATYADHAHYIDALCDFSIQSAAYLKSPKKSGHHFFQGWSPQYMLDVYYLSFLHKMKNLLLHHEKHYLHPSLYKTDVTVLTAALLSKMDYLNRKESTLSLHDLTVSEASFPLWSSMSKTEVSSAITTLFSPLKDRMHYRRRKQGRRLISKFVQQNEDRRKGRQFRALFKSLFNRHTRPLDEVVLPDGSIVSDPKDLLDVLTDHMTQWHQLNTADPAIEWPQLLTNNKYLSERQDQQLPSLQNVPANLLDAINSAMSMHTDNHNLHVLRLR